MISNEGHGGTRYRPFAFTEHGAIMTATVLNSERAIEMSVFIVLAFVRMRRALAMSIDRNEISRKITLGFYPVTNVIQPRFSWAFYPTVRQPDYDPAAADRLFDAA